MTRTAAVIGSGFGGLALAMRLQSAAVQTTIIEARDKPGGRAYFWEKDGHIFDAGPTVIGDAFWVLGFGQPPTMTCHLTPIPCVGGCRSGGPLI